VDRSFNIEAISGENKKKWTPLFRGNCQKIRDALVYEIQTKAFEIRVQVDGI
jgi:hypothetical protein